MAVRRAVALVAAWAGLGANSTAAQQPSGRPGPVVQRYQFRITLPDSGSEIRGTAVISTAVAGHDADTLRLDLVGMSVDSVNEALSLQPLPFLYDGKALCIALPGAPADVRLPPTGVPWDVRVVWHGNPHNGLIIQPNVRRRWAAFGDNWPQRAREWIPTVDDPAHKATVRWIVSAPDRMQVVANGRFEGRTPDGVGRVNWSYVETHPIPTYTMVIGATEMTVSTHRALVSGSD